MVEKFETMPLENLGTYVSDLYKDVHGFRPKHIDFNNRELLIRTARALDRYLEELASTEEGRNELSEMGWSIQ